tara:strand:+ start:5395 stop:5538 length:144 start_codon:yes stop_codon:yes gene_type:complete
MDKSKHTYEETKEVSVEYTYNNKYKKVYNIQQLRNKFNAMIDSLKKK